MSGSDLRDPTYIAVDEAAHRRARLLGIGGAVATAAAEDAKQGLCEEEIRCRVRVLLFGAAFEDTKQRLCGLENRRHAWILRFGSPLPYRLRISTVTAAEDVK